ncbi:hypothetical protein C8C77_10125 [Halanaerobium saccharolyticum]|uniref:Uncharacterized protein n=1 Tax=Halanaerobium saccharolyticum TaxID=43595 RepID=A0A4R7ZB72_9FIRM|nr:hypothetical protein C7958_10225 [Halanaerobium saccharolyticum]TDW07556.1 hypothetical protein C8C77_10125 [Halanaerobium saccharolyticum]TDX64477.1 hypothetical protein C7956_10125 [Halanaerobium saccharolyticum]
MKKVTKRVAGAGAAVGTAVAYGSLLVNTWS